MTAATPRTASGAPDLRRVGVALGAMTLAVALLVTVAVVRPAGGSTTTVTGEGRKLIVKGTNGGAIRYTGIPYAAPGNSRIRFTGVPYQAVRRGLVVKGTNGGGIRYTGIPYPVAQPAPKALPGLHGSPSGATRGDMSSAAYAAQNPAVAANIANQKATAAAIAARDAARDANRLSGVDISSAIYAAQQQAASKASSALSAALNSAPVALPATRGDMSAAAYAALNSAPAGLPADINAAIYAAQQQAAADMSAAAYAAQHPTPAVAPRHQR